MNDRHEQSRAAFEACYNRHALTRLNVGGEDYYSDPTIHQRWADWCRALDYAAEQQAKQCQCDMRTKLVGDGCSVCNPEKAKEYMDDEAPTPLTRPDRPGWWWRWITGECMVSGKPGWIVTYLGQHDLPTFDTETVWLPATPPPAPRSTQDQ